MGNHRADRRAPRNGPSESPTSAAGGKRRAVKPARHSGSRGSLFKSLPSTPVLLGVAALAVSAGGAVTAAGTSLTGAEQPRLSQASALSGASDVARVSLLEARTAAISRDSRRDALADAADEQLVAQAEQQAEEHGAALAQLTKQAETQAKKLAANAWVLPMSGYHLTAGFGEYSGLWSHYHTGLDFAAPSGTPIHAVANGTITETSSAGAYGNRTIQTLKDGTQIWYCHQTSFTTETGDRVHAGEVIGSVGSTGNTTGPHLHLEVRPAASGHVVPAAGGSTDPEASSGDPVDPFTTLRKHGLAP